MLELLEDVQALHFRDFLSSSFQKSSICICCDDLRWFKHLIFNWYLRSSALLKYPLTASGGSKHQIWTPDTFDRVSVKTRSDGSAPPFQTTSHRLNELAPVLRRVCMHLRCLSYRQHSTTTCIEHFHFSAQEDTRRRHTIRKQTMINSVRTRHEKAVLLTSYQTPAVARFKGTHTYMYIYIYIHDYTCMYVCVYNIYIYIIERERVPLNAFTAGSSLLVLSRGISWRLSFFWVRVATPIYRPAKPVELLGARWCKKGDPHPPAATQRPMAILLCQRSA